jgi:hypothetical protein
MPFLPLDPGSRIGKNQDPGSRMGKKSGSGSGIGDLVPFDPWIRDPGMGKKSGSESGMNNPDHISESLENHFFGLKYSNSLTQTRDPG